MTVRVLLGKRSYDIAIKSDDLTGLGTFVLERCRTATAFVVTDENVAAHAASISSILLGNGIRTGQSVLPPGEAQKCLISAAKLYDHLADFQADRKTLVVAVGGGVIGDLAGFVAATYARGLPLLMIPTTLLAMVDSSVGGKVGVNHPNAKNLIGAFHQPVGVWIDASFLVSLPDREFRSGLGEVVKYGVSLDADLFSFVEAHVDAILQRDSATLRHIITRSCELKASIVEKDEHEESGLRALLNYGHTFAHAFETVGGYGTWLHGEAVAAGMMCAALIAEHRRLITLDVVFRQKNLLARIGLPTTPLDWGEDQVIDVMRNDKKALAGQMRFVLPQRLGSAKLFDDVSEGEVRQVLRESRTCKT
jgi:3-dehydroquinate synthase